MYADQHLHTSFSGDSETPPEEQAEKAIALGMEAGYALPIITIMTLCPILILSWIYHGIWLRCRSLKRRCSGRLDIRTGIELGLQSHVCPVILYKLTEEYPFDFVIGSVHFIDGPDPCYPEYFEKHGKNSCRLSFETLLGAE